MIKKIEKIDKFRIFQKFRWNSDMPEFKRFNLIYGWNGSGKTTLSELFRRLEKKDANGAKFEVELDGEKILRSNDLASSSVPRIRVFNRHFVEENVFTKEGQVEPIFYLGEEDISKQKEVQELQESQEKLKSDLEKASEELESKKGIIDDTCKGGAKTIKSHLIACGYDRYNKTKFEKKCEELKDFREEDITLRQLSEEQLADHLQKINNPEKDSLRFVALSDFDFESLCQDTRVFLERQIVSSVIGRFKEDKNLNDWAQKGFRLLQEISTENCPFCNQILPDNFYKELEGHFNNEYEKFVCEIEKLHEKIDQSIKKIKNIELPDKARLYDHLQEEYIARKNVLEEESARLISNLQMLEKKIKDKKANPFQSYSLQDFPQCNIEERLEKLNEVIEENNNISNNHEKEIEDSCRKIEESFVAESLADYKDRKKELSDIKLKISSLQKGIDEKENKINYLHQEIRTHQKPADIINDLLARYLGRDDIRFKVLENGYEITRRGESARDLSEGEKTAVAFVYFLTTLTDENFKLEEGIVVIDDPISSLDSNAIYHAFGLMKEKVKNAKQLFILTHNFTFFKQVKHWFSYHKNKYRFFMIKRSSSNGLDSPKIMKLSDLICDHESEYHYLFKRIYDFTSEEIGESIDCYLLPNVARRFLEGFLAFKVPNKTSFTGQMRELEKEDFPYGEIQRINRFLNVYSHKPACGDNSQDDLSILSESQPILKQVLELVKQTDKAHFDRMVEVVSKK